MDDISQDEVYGTPQPTPLRTASRPVTGRSRERRLRGSNSCSSLYVTSPRKGQHASSAEDDPYRSANGSPRKSSERMNGRAAESLRSHSMTNGVNGYNNNNVNGYSAPATD